MECIDESENYIMIKDQKENFPEKPSFRLINPLKSNSGKVSKHILGHINQIISQNTNVKQWENSTLVRVQFKAIINKQQCFFSVFEVGEFYISISLDLYEKALNFPKEITPTADIDLRIMTQSTENILFHGGESFIKRESNENFNVPMGCFDGADECKLVGTYILSQLNTV